MNIIKSNNNFTDWFLSKHKKNINCKNIEVIECSYSNYDFKYVIKIHIAKTVFKDSDADKYFQQVLVKEAEELARRYKMDFFSGFTYKYEDNELYITNEHSSDDPRCFHHKYFWTINGHIVTCPMMLSLEVLHTLVNKYLTAKALRKTKGVLLEYDATKEFKFESFYMNEFNFSSNNVLMTLDSGVHHEMSEDAVNKQLHDIFVTKAQELITKYKVPVTSNPFSYKNTGGDCISVQIKIQEKDPISKDTLKTVIEIFGILIDLDLSSKSEVGCSILNIPFYFNFKK